MIARSLGIGAGLRRPDAFTKLKLRFDGEGQVIRDLTGQTITVNGDTTQTATNRRFLGKCAVFDGDNDNLQVGSKANLDFLHQVGTAGKWSISLWYRAASFADNRAIFDNCRFTSANVGASLAIQADRTVVVLICRASSGNLVLAGFTTGTVPNDTNWHYMVVTYDQALASANCKVYIDGSLLAGTLSKTANAPSTSTSTDLPIVGASSQPGFYLNDFYGNMDELTIQSGICIDGTKVPTRRT